MTVLVFGRTGQVATKSCAARHQTTLYGRASAGLIACPFAATIRVRLRFPLSTERQQLVSSAGNSGL